MRGALRFDFGPRSAPGEDGEDRAERLRSRLEQSNQWGCYPGA